jgi:hypothetical protein
MANGILSKPPTLLNKKQQAKFSNLQQKAATGDLNNKQQRKLSNLEAVASGQVRTPKTKYEGLTKNQSASINQRLGQDIALGDYAGGLMPKVWDSYSQDFDWEGLPSAPVSGDFNQWRQGQIDSTYGDFTRRMDPQFARQSEDFEQQMANRGIPVGSDLYNQQKGLLNQQQSDARQSALVAAQGLAGQNAGQFFDIGSRAREGALTEGMTRRDMPLSDIGKLYSLRSPMDQQNLAFSQAKHLQDTQYHPPVFGPADPYMGFGSAENKWAAEDARNRANQLWQWQNQPKPPKGPSTGSQIAGGILGAGLNIGSSILSSGDRPWWMKD